MFLKYCYRQKYYCMYDINILVDWTKLMGKVFISGITIYFSIMTFYELRLKNMFICVN